MIEREVAATARRQAEGTGTMQDVLVVGAGPVGLTLACELVRHGLRPRIVDRMQAPLPYCRAIGVTSRTLEIWDDMGLAREMIDAGLWITGLRSIIQGHPPEDVPAPSLDLPFAALGLPQYETERILARQLARSGIPVERGVSLSGLRQDGDGVTARLDANEGLSQDARFRFIVGCDGAHSAVRHLAGIGFEGEAYSWPFMLGDVHIDWDVPYGMSVRALRLHEDAPPDMFIAIPLPDRGRYRISMLAPPSLAPEGGTTHGIQTELKGPSLGDLQEIADNLLPDRPRLTDLRWSSLFRISMRLADSYRQGRVFIAGDAAHIHPPTGGQGMNTGIQDAYNLAWKLALVLQGFCPESLLDSYEGERRPVGAAVVARTRAASEGYGRERGGAPDRLADAQVDISYKDTDWVGDDPVHASGMKVVAGDRAPDVGGLRRHGIGFPLRLFDVLRGTDHVLLAYCGRVAADGWLDAFSTFALSLRPHLGEQLRLVAIRPGDATGSAPGVTLLSDPANTLADVFGPDEGAVLVRPDGHIAWTGPSWRAPSLTDHLDRLFPHRSGRVATPKS